MDIIVEKPWWFFIGGNTMCVTMFGHIWVPASMWPNPAPWVIAHEKVHLVQQSKCSMLTWLLRWKWDRDFRLNSEAEAYAVQIQMYPKDYQFAINELASSDYDWAATSTAEAKAVLDSYLAKLGVVPPA